MTHIIAIGHRPPGGELRIVTYAGYGLALLPGESIATMVAAAEAVRIEKESRPLLGETEEWTEELCQSK